MLQSRPVAPNPNYSQDVGSDPQGPAQVNEGNDGRGGDEKGEDGVSE